MAGSCRREMMGGSYFPLQRCTCDTPLWPTQTKVSYLIMMVCFRKELLPFDVAIALALDHLFWTPVPLSAVPPVPHHLCSQVLLNDVAFSSSSSYLNQ